MGRGAGEEEELEEEDKKEEVAVIVKKELPLFNHFKCYIPVLKRNIEEP